MPKTIAFRHLGASADLTLWDDGTATLSALYSKEPQMGQGSALMHRILAYADELDLVVDLTVRRFGNPRGPDNHQLVEFYERFGFRTRAVWANKESFMVRQIGEDSQELHGP